MAHCCPSCKEAAPVLFRFCPECSFDMKDCIDGECKHSPATMGEKYFLEHGECLGCGGNKNTCKCFTKEAENIS